ncbi:substrate-binding domain-containing protein [Mesorhizobium australicum]|uniref:Amino acid/amide ABC transporter substrate-binding protein, HAAT family n=1 Tax=Mesorhizobium australicum TaxID=536018 RepID=A0A1X7N455_9HYPH|nr:amino acid/amide ABC transporter substrate-binding protein, HAAT family [Mesorhizobium australicum]
MRRLLTALAAASALMVAQPVLAQDGPAKIALIHGLSGSPLEAYSKQTHTGFEMGLEYATKGTNEIKGRKIELVKKDSQFKPDIARALLAEAYADEDVVFAVGDTSSGVAMAMLPVAAENEKILLVEPAVADGLTGKDSNRYVFKTSRNSSMDMQAQALALKPDSNLYIATLAQDYAFGRDGVVAFKTALEGTGANLVHEEYVPQQTTDFTAPIERLFNALKDKQGRKVIVIYVAGIDAMTPLVTADPGRYGIELSTGGNILPALAGYKKVPGMEGAIYYYYEAPKNPVNDWFVAEHQKRFNAPPDFFTAGGFAAAMAVAKALETASDWETETLIKTMEGMSFDTPKGPMTFRTEDHQALQSMYHFKIKVDPNVAWAIPELVREIKPEEMKIPIGRNNQQ